MIWNLVLILLGISVCLGEVSMQAHGFSATFGDSSPNYVMRLNDSWVEVTFLRLQELSANKSVMMHQEMMMPNFQMENTDKLISFSGKVGSADVKLDFEMIDDDMEYDFEGFKYDIPGKTLKFTLTISNWHFSSKDNWLRAHLVFNYSAPMLNSTGTHTEDMEKYMVGNKEWAMSCNMLNWAMIDGVKSEIQGFWKDEFQFYIYYPYFNETVVHDPSFQILVEGDQDKLEGDEDQESSPDLPLSYITIGVLCVVLVVAGVIVGSVYYNMKRRERNSLKGRPGDYD